MPSTTLPARPREPARPAARPGARQARRAGSGAALAILATLAGAFLAAHLQLRAVDGNAPASDRIVAAGGEFRPPVVDIPRQTSSADPKAPTTPATSAPSVRRRFAWAPVDGASRYHVEIFDGDSRVFVAETTRPEISIAERVFGRRPSAGSQGYRWYVWPVVAGKRASGAVVQATIPS